MLAGCMKETMEPGTQVSGNFTEDDGTGQSRYYISFSDGQYRLYVPSEEPYTFMENAFWAANGFVEATKSGYSIRDGRLYVGDKDYGKISLSNGCLTIGNIKYETVEAFREENYSSISLPQGTTAVVDYTAQTLVYPYSVERPIPSGKVGIRANQNWIRNCSLADGNITFQIEDNNSGLSRSGDITLFYPGAKDVVFTLTQQYAQASIDLTPSSMDVDYMGGSFSFGYSVSNPRIGASVTAQSQVRWITNVSVSGNQVSYRVSENSTVSDRTGLIVLRYGVGSVDYASAAFQIGQFVNLDQASDLSASGTANCYIVPSSGIYKFKAVKGNSNISVGTVASAEVLWESFGTSQKPNVGDVIYSAVYSADYVYFSTPSTLKNGNAVIAVKDASNNVLWSWHIWICNGYSPIDLAQTYYNNAGVMMDRNLGATSATPGDVGALGLLYQWGRKDPFLGSSSISSNTQAASTLSWPSAVASNSSNGTIAYAVVHPTRFITCNSSNYDWYYTGSSSTDDTRWQSTKTIYDPCPPGWRVPDGGNNGVWSKACGHSSSISGYPFDDTNKGMNFSGKFGASGTIWYPAAGYLRYDYGSLNLVGSFGYWWSCTPNDNYAYRLNLYLSGNVDPSYNDRRAYGRSVRCFQE